MSNSLQKLADQLSGVQYSASGTLTGGFVSVRDVTGGGGTALTITNENACYNAEDCKGSTNSWSCTNEKICLTATSRSYNDRVS